MTTWAAAEAEFGAVLDGASAEGPQLVTRRDEEYVVLTKAEWEARKKELEAALPPGESLWDRLCCPPEPGDPELEITRAKDDARWVEF